MPTEPQTPITAKPPINALAQYLLALAGVITCYSLYAKFAVPLIEGPAVAVKRRAITRDNPLPSSRDDKSYLVPLVPKDAWELSDCKTLLTDSGMLLFKDIEKQPDGTIKFAPFTLITRSDANSTDGQDEKGSHRPMVLRCVEGAKLKFDKPVNSLMSGGAKIESAKLDGEVDIYRPPSGVDKHDALHVATSEVQIEKDRVYSLEEVSFSFGPNRGRGRNLMLELDHDTNSQATFDFSNVSGIKRVELAFLYQLRIEPSVSSNDLVVTQPNQPGVSAGEGTSSFSDSKSPIEITCKGPFVFDYASKTASFSDTVVAEQVDAYRDRINCEELLITFDERSKTDIASKIESSTKNKDALDSSWELRRIVAQGLPAIVVFKSRSAKITGDYISYDDKTGEVVGRSSPTTGNQVTIVSPQYQLVTPEISYFLQPDRSLGPFRLPHGGRLLKVGDERSKPFFLSWEKSLVSSPVPQQPSLRRIQVNGEPKIRIGDDTHVDASQIELTVQQTQVLRQENNGNLKQSWDYQPLKLQANEDIEIRSPKFDAQVEQLVATWHAGTQLPRSSRSYRKAVPHRAGYRGAAPQITQQPVRQSAFVETSPDLRQASFEADALKPRKMKLKGQQLNLQLKTLGRETQLLGLVAQDNVSVEAVQQPAERSPRKFRLTGQTLKIVPQAGEDNYRTLVSGAGDKLATIVTEQLNLTGEQINLDQVANKLWVQGRGAVELNRSSNPIDADSSVAQTRVQEDGLSLQRPSQLSVSWGGGMVFDGTKIYFERNIISLGEQTQKNGNRSQHRTSSQAMSIELEEPVDFHNISRIQKDKEIKIREVVVVDTLSPTKQVFQLVGQSQPVGEPPRESGVMIDNRVVDPAGKQIEQQQIVVHQASINQATGNIVAQGPGTIATLQFTESSNKRKRPTPLSKFGSKNKTGLTFVRINFDGQLFVDSIGKDVQVKGNVRTVYSPADNWQQSFDPDEVHQRAPGGVYMTCEQLQIAQWTSRKSQDPIHELVASGNAHVVGELIEATADRISYSESNDLLIVAGTPRSDANLRYKRTPNDRVPTRLVAEKIKYRVSDQWTHVENAKNISGRQ